MSDENGKPAPIPPAATRGGVNLAASLLRNAVDEILHARMDQPMPLAPTFRQSVGVNMPDGRALTPGDVEFIRAQYEQKWWLIATQVRMLGLSEKTDGDFALVEVGYGQREDNGNLFAEFVLQWTPHALVEAPKPTLSLAP